VRAMWHRSIWRRPPCTYDVAQPVSGGDSDEAGHLFRSEGGHPFRREAGHYSETKPDRIPI
jgi:hypothetical protein